MDESLRDIASKPQRHSQNHAGEARRKEAFILGRPQAWKGEGETDLTLISVPGHLGLLCSNCKAGLRGSRSIVAIGKLGGL